MYQNSSSCHVNFCYNFIDEGGIVSTKFSLVTGGVGAQARQALENMKAIVESSGSGLHNVVSL